MRLLCSFSVIIRLYANYLQNWAPTIPVPPNSADNGEFTVMYFLLYRNLTNDSFAFERPGLIKGIINFGAVNF